ncbi:hypothetical protein M758_12G023700 [Ceratodon purpureus]|nr:hypothetical protein M758_12G023700 [Ceratodon purpureus]
MVAHNMPILHRRRRWTCPLATIPECSELIVPEDDSTMMINMVRDNSKRKMDQMLPQAQMHGQLLKRCKHIRPDVANTLEDQEILPPPKLHRSNLEHAKDVTKKLVQKLFPNLLSRHSEHCRRSIGISLGVRSSLQYLV